MAPLLVVVYSNVGVIVSFLVLALPRDNFNTSSTLLQSSKGNYPLFSPDQVYNDSDGSPFTHRGTLWDTAEKEEKIVEVIAV